MTRIQPLSSSKANSEQKLQEKSQDAKERHFESPRVEIPKIGKGRKVLNCVSSIKFILILIIFLLILSCTIVFDSIWITAFSSAVGTLSEQIRKFEFDVIISYTETTIRNVILATESSKSQMYTNFDLNNQTVVIDHTFRLYKVLNNHMDNFVHSLVIGDSNGNAYGIESNQSSLMFTTINSGKNQTYWNCKDPNQSDNCDFQINSYRVISTSNYYSDIFNEAISEPGKTIITPSFVDSNRQLNIASASSTLLGANKIKNYVSIVMNLGVFSDFLRERTVNISGATVFAFETKSRNLVATGGMEVIALSASSRITLSNIGGNITKIGNQISSQLNDNFHNIACNTNVSYIADNNYLSVRRLCIDEGVDWIFVHSVPQWNYIGGMIFAIICAIIGSVAVVIFGLVMATVFSVKVVQPFQNLIESFEMVSNMELDNFHLSKTLLSEVRSLQVHFIGMVERIKLYRKFIPSHLLSKLDNSEVEPKQKYESEAPLHEKSKDTSFSNSSSNLNSQSGLVSNNRRLTKQHTSLNMFSLYLEKKKVTSVSVFIGGINGVFINATPKESLSILCDLFDTINYVTKTSNGLAGKFENESVTIQFNASGEQAKHEMKGLQCCHTLSKKLKSLNESKLSKNSVFENNPSLKLEFRVVATTQECKCGNVGTKEVMNFGVFGSVQFNTQYMIESAQELNVPIVISQELFQKVDGKFHVRFIDFKNFITDEYYSYPSIASDKSTINCIQKIYELGESVNIEADEWMYELNAKEKNERWKIYNEATEEYFNDNLNQCLNLISTHLQNYPNDKVALNLKRNCEKKNL